MYFFFGNVAILSFICWTVDLLFTWLLFYIEITSRANVNHVYIWSICRQKTLIFARIVWYFMMGWGERPLFTRSHKNHQDLWLRKLALHAYSHTNYIYKLLLLYCSLFVYCMCVCIINLYNDECIVTLLYSYFRDHIALATPCKRATEEYNVYQTV